MNQGRFSVRLLHRLVQMPARSDITCHSAKTTSRSHPSSPTLMSTLPPHASSPSPISILLARSSPLTPMSNLLPHASSSTLMSTLPPRVLLKNLLCQSAASNTSLWKPSSSYTSNLVTDGHTTVSIGVGGFSPVVPMTLSFPTCVLNTSRLLYLTAVDDCPSGWNGVECSSVLKKRRKKMNKHKYKKWLKKTRIMRRKLKK